MDDCIKNFNSHAPCGARPAGYACPEPSANFNSHAPCGARLDFSIFWGGVPLFQLTRPLRGATPRCGRCCPPVAHFNSHAPCGARRLIPASVLMPPTFQLTRPLRGATRSKIFAALVSSISTHTPLAGRDPIRTARCHCP